MTTKKSALVDQIQDRTATDSSDLVSAVNHNGDLVTANGAVALLTTDIDADDVIVLCFLPHTAVVQKIEIANDDLDSNGSPTLTFDVGLYDDVDGATARDDDVYATVSTQFQAAAGFTDLAFEARDIAVNGQAVWADAGFADLAAAKASNLSGQYLAIHIDTVAATAVAGDVAFRVTYVDG